MDDRDGRIGELLERRAAGFEPRTGALDRLHERARRRHRARRATAGAVALSTFAAVVGGFWLATRGQDGPVPPAPADELTVQVGGVPTDIVVGEGGVWVAVWTGATQDDLSGELVRLDPVTGEERARIPFAEMGDLAVGGGGVWVTGLRTQTLTKVDPATNEVAAVFDLPALRFEVAEGDAGFLPNQVEVGFGRVWVSTARGAVLSLDPETGEVLSEYGEPGLILGDLAVGADGVWVDVALVPAEILHLDPSTGALVGSTDAPGPIMSIAADDRSLWVSYEPTEQVCPGGAEACAGVFALHREEGTTRTLAASWPKVAGVLTAADGVAFLAGTDGSIWRVGEEDGTVLESLGGPATSIAHDGASLWIGSEDGTVMRIPDRPVGAPTVEPSPEPTTDPTTEPTVEPTQDPAPVPTGACAFPALRPTYLPWLAEGDPISDPVMSRSFDGGGPQQLDPGYSIITWPAAGLPGPGPGNGSVHMWRSTQSVGALPADPEVPPLPDGSEGKLYGPYEGEDDVAIYWVDAFPDSHPDDCSETLLGLRIPGATVATLRQEILRVAESLESFDWEASWPRSSEDGAFAVWPQDTPDAAMADGASMYTDPDALALSFGDHVLGWFECSIFAERSVETLPGQAPVAHRLYEIQRQPGGPTVEVEVAELLPDRWFVTAVYGAVVHATVTAANGWTLEVAWDGPDGGEVEVRAAFGDQEEIVERQTLDGTGVGTIRIDHLVNRFEMNVPGHVIVLFRDANGVVYVATAYALPPGESSTG